MSSVSTQTSTPDLTQAYPRSPNDMIGPYVLLARILDKCRAVIAGTNGDYQFNCSLDRRFFEFTALDAEAFKTEVATGKTDEEMLTWVKGYAKPCSEQEILAWVFETRWSRPHNPERMARFESLRQECCPDKPYVETWFQLLDADEGRF